MEDDGSMSRQEFVDQIVEHFEYRLRKETTKYSLVFPTCFYIYLSPSDYLQQKEAFPFTVLDAVNCFHEKISSRLKEYPEFRQFSRYWQFQFLKFEEGTVLEDFRTVVDEVEPGRIFVLSAIFSKENVEVASSDTVRVVATRRNKSTVKTHQLSVNMEALRGLMQESEDRYKVNITSYGRVGQDSVAKDGPKALAKLRIAPFSDSVCFLVGGQSAEICNMLSDELQVTGKNGVELGGIQTLKVSSDSILNPHFKIERTPSGFRLRAFGDLVLNEVPMEKGESQPLPNNSSILLNNSIQISFKTV